MSNHIDADLCVIGAGSGGLSVAAGASQMGSKTVLFEGGKMGGDCLNYGCVPSKAMLAAGKAVHTIRHAQRFGITVGEPTIDFKAVHDHVHAVIGAIEPNDSVERFEGLGVTVIQNHARFADANTVTDGETTVRARRIVIATGSSAFVPPIPGLDSVPFLTNETIFERTELPDHLIVVGGGPIGCELAQAHRNLGAKVTVLEMMKIMPNDDPELVDVARHRLIVDGIDLLEEAKVTGVEKTPGGAIKVCYEKDGTARSVEGTDLLLAVGRRPNVNGLDLEKAGIEYSPRGIKVDARLRTTNKKVFAIGDVSGGFQFTHVAGYHAGIVIKNALFRLPSKVDYKALPWVTYTEPEVAQVGVNEVQAKEKHGEIKVLRWPYHENDRAQAEHATDGLIKVVTDKKGKVLGAGIVGSHAGELIAMWGLAISRSMKIGAVANMIAAYPTLSEVGKRAAGSYYTPSLFSERTRKVVRLLAKLG